MTETGFTILKIPKEGGAYAFGLEARTHAINSTGAGGYLNAKAVASGWHDVEFATIVGAGVTIPVSIGASAIAAANLFSGSATVIGGSTPNGDLRSEADGYLGIGNTTPYNFLKGQEYSGAFFAVYKGNPSIANSDETGKIGIGTSSTEITTSGYYEGPFTTREIYEFQPSFTVDSTDLTKIPTGSGVYTDTPTLQFNILNRNGQALTSAAQIAADPFVKEQRISILNTDGTVVFPNYRVGGDSTFTLTRSQNIDVFGTYTRNFGIRNEVVNEDGGVHTSEFYLYANTVTFDKIFVRSSGETVLNENYTNHSPPNTGGITTAENRANAIKYFNNQPVNESGTTGFIEADIGFNEDSSYVALGDVTIWQGATKDFVTNRSSLVGNYPLNSIQQGQKIRLTANDGVPEGTPLFFKLAVDSEVGFNEEIFTIGPITLEPEVEGPDLNLYNQGDQTLVGDFTIEAGLEGDAEDGGNLNVSGNALGTGEAGRLTGPTGIPYLLSGDAAGGGGSDTLQDVVDRGNATTTDINFNGSKIIFNGDSDKSIGYSTDSPEGLLLGADVESIKSAHSNTFVLFPDQAVAIGASATIIGASPATGSAVLGGTGNTISGHFNTLVGGAINKISGDTLGFNFIGGGSGVDIVNTKYSAVVGGYNNDIIDGGTEDAGFIGAGRDNLLSGTSVSVIAGGHTNKIIGGNKNIIVGGDTNLISGSFDANTIAGGVNNRSFATMGFIGAGGTNTILGPSNAPAILGGVGNTATGTSATTVGGSENIASGNFTIAAGRKAKAVHEGATVFADGQNRNHTSSGDNTATFDFAGGVHVPTSGMFGQGLFVSGVPVLTGENNPAEADTLQTVTTRGNTTSTSILSTGPHISGISGLFGDRVGIGNNNPQDFNSEGNRLVVGDGSAAQGMTIFAGTSHSASLYFADGTVGSAAYQGWVQYRHGNSRLDFGAAGGRRMSLDGNGLAIGDITSPSAELEISSSLPAIRLTDSDLTNHFSEIERAGTSLNFYSRSNASNGKFVFLGDNGTSDTEFMRIETDGDVGIGSNAPSAKLDVAGGIKLLDNNYLTWNSSNTRIVGNSSYLQFQVGASDKVRIQSDGHVGIGTNTAPSELTVFSTDSNSATASVHCINNNETGALLRLIEGDNHQGGFLQYDGSANKFNIGVHDTNDTTFANDTKAITIDRATANVGIGTVNPQSRLHVANATGNDLGLIFTNPTETVRQYFVDDSTDSDFFITYDGNGGAEITLQHDGKLALNASNGDNVGIGTIDPARKLEVSESSSSIVSQFKSTAGTSAFITLSNTTASADQIRFGSIGNDLVLSTNYTEKFRIKSGGNVGIGTDNPSETLHVLGTTRLGDRGYTGGASIEYASFSETNGGASTIVGNAVYAGNANNTYRKTRSDDGNFIALNYNKGITFHTHVTGSASSAEYDINNHEQVRITTGGYVGIGTNNPNSTLHVEGDITGAGDVLGTGAGNRITNQGVPYLLSGDSPAETQTLQDVCDNGNTTTTAVNISGAITVANNIFKNVENSSLGLYGGTDTLTNDGFIKIHGNSNNWGKVQTNIGYDATNSKAHWTLNNTTELMTLKGDGSLGIGTQTPARKLDVSTSASDTYGIRNSYNASYYMEMAHNRFNTVGNNYIRFNIDDATKMTIVDSDFGGGVNGVGIGITNPTTELQVIGTISGSGSFLGTGVGNRITNNHVPYLLSGDSPAENDTLQDVTTRGNTTSTSILSTGPHISGVTGLFSNQVGIGTDIPETTLELATTMSSSPTTQLYLDVDGSNNVGGGGELIISTSASAGAKDAFNAIVRGERSSLNDGSSDLTFLTTHVPTSATAAARMTIKDAGNVGIGTTDPDQTLHVKGIGMIEDTSSTAYGTLQFGTNTSRYIRGNSAELQVGSTIQQLHFQNTSAAGQIASSAADGTDAIQILARTVHTSANILEVVNGNGAAPIFAIDYTGNVDISGHVGIGTESPQADLQVTGSGVFGTIGSNTPNSTVTVAGYDNFGLDFRAHGTWTHWKARVGHGRNFELYNDGTVNQRQVLELGKTTKDNASVYVRSTGAFIEVGMNASTSIPVVSMGCLADSDHLGGAYLDVRDAVASTHRYEFNRDGTFVASGISVSGDVLGTGVGNRITNDGTPYLLSGDSPAETQNLQDVTDNGATTTNAIKVANGTIISGSAATTPAADLYVFGSGNSDVINAVRERNDASIKVTSQTAGAYFRTNSATATYNGLDLNSNWFIGQYGYNDLRIVDGTASAGGAATAITVQNTTKYVGIGTTNPTQRLHVKAEQDGDYVARITNTEATAGANYGLKVDGGSNSSDVAFEVSSLAGSSYLHVRGDGNVGIGTNAPITKLVVDTPMTRGQTNPSGLIVTDSANGAMALEMGVDRTSSASYIESRHTGSSTNYTLLLNPSYGKVGVGTTSPTSKFEVGTVAYGTNSIAKFWDGTDGVEITNRGASRQQIDFLGSNTSAINAKGSLFINYDSDNGGSNDTITFARNGVDEAGTVDMVITEGKVGIGTATITQGDVEIYKNGADAELCIHEDAGTHEARLHLRRGGSDWDIINNNQLAIETEGTEVFRITTVGNVGIGTSSPSNALDVVGHFSATSKSFLIDHPTKENKKLQYGSLEGPENGVYVRGTTDEETIELPEYWSELVHDESITVVLTPIGKKQDLFIIKKSNKLIKIGGVEGSFDYVVYGERKDIDKLEVEPLKV